MRSLLTLLLMAIMTLSVSAQSTETYILTSATSEKVGKSYLAAYIDLNWDQIAPFWRMIVALPIPPRNWFLVACVKMEKKP
jgi:hypothetical protein|uniref:hypothetical protein n=1 Tax=Cephaloticoccus sp. TaxID=1985742 RepID=UPI00404AB16A